MNCLRHKIWERKRFNQLMNGCSQKWNVSSRNRELNMGWYYTINTINCFLIHYHQLQVDRERRLEVLDCVTKTCNNDMTPSRLPAGTMDLMQQYGTAGTQQSGRGSRESCTRSTCNPHQFYLSGTKCLNISIHLNSTSNANIKQCCTQG